MKKIADFFYCVLTLAGLIVGTIYLFWKGQWLIGSAMTIGFFWHLIKIWKDLVGSIRWIICGFKKTVDNTKKQLDTTTE